MQSELGRLAPKLLGAVCAIALTAGLVTGCGSSDDGGATATAQDTGLEVIWAGSQPATTPFATVMVNGFEAAGKNLGVDVEYLGPASPNFDATEVQKVVENAIAKGPDGLLVSDFDPGALNPAIEKAIDEGIPVVTVNAGAGEPEKTGMLAYVGNDERASGERGGELLGEEGASHALLVTATPGIPIVDDRNGGFEKGFPGKVTTAALPLAELGDATKIKNVVETELSKDPSIDAVFTVGDCCSGPTLAAVENLGGRGKDLKLGTMDLGKPVLNAIKDGRMSFALDQQQWLQGYLGLQTVVQNLQYGFTPGSTEIPTGPAVVDSENIDQVIELTKQGIR